MKIITCASYYGSGSSAVSDLVAEYSDVKDMSDYEFRFLHDIDGVSDLEFHLTECHNRHNSGHALKRFMKLSKFNAGNFLNKRYEPFFGGKYYKITKEYIDELTDFSFKGWWFYDLYDKGSFIYYIKQLQSKILNKATKGRLKIMDREMTLCSHPNRDKFLQATRNYVAKLVRAANTENKPVIEFDQIVPSQNINRILNYFSDDIRVFVVDRDPRDVYALEKFVWKSGVCPADDVFEFCKWFEYTHKSGSDKEIDETKVLYIRFEDMIYKYDETKAKIESFAGLEAKNHTETFKKFNPKRSVRNTQVWKNRGIDEDIKKIEQRLAPYIYDFESVSDKEIAGVEPDASAIF